MKQIGLALILLVSAWTTARAQVSVEILLEQDQFLPAESMPLAVRITNRSGQTLRLGADNHWLTLSVEARDSSASVVPRLGEMPVEGYFELENGKMATKRLDISPHFLLSRAGRFAVIASVHVPGWDAEITSAPKVFMVIEGTRLWERDFGIPGTANADGVPEFRKYILQQANYLRGQIRLYMRLTDASGLRTIRVTPVGPMVSFSRPEPQVDRSSNLHVLYQNGPHAFSYVVYNPNGEMTIRQTFDYTNTRPRLRLNPEGDVIVSGGVRRITSTDFPPPPPESESPIISTNEVELPSPET
ncbi:MAG TPA: hypothetical protein VN673_18775 [Clostridia bacterium]|nr:hypothetical protein [Clostridia bacterium]